MTPWNLKITGSTLFILVGGALIALVAIGVKPAQLLQAEIKQRGDRYETSDAIGCPPGMIEDMSIGQCVPSKPSSTGSIEIGRLIGGKIPSSVLAATPSEKRQVANTLLSESTADTDIEAAAELYRLAALNGDTTSQFSLAIMLAQGIGVEENKNEALRWLREAALNGHAIAQVIWGSTLINGDGVEVNIQVGNDWVVQGMQKLSEEYPNSRPRFLGT